MRIFDELVRLFLRNEHSLASDRTGESADFELQAAVALVLLEAAHGDEEYVWREHSAIVGALKRGFGIGRKEVLELLERSEMMRPPNVRLDQITQIIADRFDQAQREEIVRLLWKIVRVDGVVFEWEHVFATHVANAVGVGDSVEIRRDPNGRSTS